MPTSRTKKAAGKRSAKPLSITSLAAEQAERFKWVRAKVNAFADAHPRFDELGSEIEKFLRGGLDLKAAYSAAVALDDLKHKPIKIQRAKVKEAIRRVIKKWKAEARTSSP